VPFETTVTDQQRQALAEFVSVAQTHRPASTQVLLTAYADSAPGTACPSKVGPCPRKAAAIAARALLKPVAVADFAAVKTRLDKVGTKVKP
jgi:hypothetical protein